MKERCPESRLLGTAILDGYELGFTIYSPERQCGCADIVQCSGGKVFGLLYGVTEKNLEKLDGFEGVPDKYRRISVKVANKVGELKTAESYEVVHKESEYQPPSRAYLELLIHAAERFDFPAEYLNKLRRFACRDGSVSSPLDPQKNRLRGLI